MKNPKILNRVLKALDEIAQDPKYLDKVQKTIKELTKQTEESQDRLKEASEAIERNQTLLNQITFLQDNLDLKSAVFEEDKAEFSLEMEDFDLKKKRLQADLDREKADIKEREDKILEQRIVAEKDLQTARDILAEGYTKQAEADALKAEYLEKLDKLKSITGN